jgi:hypothetical protein
MKASDCVLYSGGLQGAEAAFGAAAERHGVAEVNFTFEGREVARHRGLRTLTAEELVRGDVSLQYVSKLMHRHYPNTSYIKSVLQTIWHQVNNAQEIYVVGVILGDDTVKGGTGWGAEFAKLCNKPLFVFDQGSSTWKRWAGTGWENHEPAIGHPHFAGTGTRNLTAAGAQAIEALYSRSFR